MRVRKEPGARPLGVEDPVAEARGRLRLLRLIVHMIWDRAEEELVEYDGEMVDWEELFAGWLDSIQALLEGERIPNLPPSGSERNGFNDELELLRGQTVHNVEVSRKARRKKEWLDSVSK